MPTLEEDVNENPVHAPEKSSFVPHLPGLREDDDSHFFGYFTVIGVICLAGYVGYHNKQKVRSAYIVMLRLHFISSNEQMIRY